MLLKLIDRIDAKNNVSKLYNSYFLCMGTLYIKKVSQSAKHAMLQAFIFPTIFTQRHFRAFLLGLPIRLTFILKFQNFELLHLDNKLI